MKKLLLVFICLLLFVGCEKKGEESTILKDGKTVLMNVMNSKQEFIDESGNKVLFKDFVIYENDKAVPDKYVFIDLDNDNLEEMAILTTSYYGAYIILDIDGDDVYGYMLGARSFVDLKEDGTFTGSGGAAVTGYSKMTISNNKINIEELAYFDDMEKKYTINGENVTKDEIDNYITEWNKKPSVKWVKVGE